MAAVKLIAPLALATALAHPGSLLSSRQLWATVDVCNASDQPHTIGIRGSMPGDGHPKDRMFMRFRVQYQEPAGGRWMNVNRGADSGFVSVGAANVARQAGRSFQFAPTAGKPAYVLRGWISFQWRRGATVLATATRTTSTGHRSLAGADPPGYSAAACTLS